MHLSGPEIVALLVALGAFSLPPLWAVIDAAVRPDWAWDAVGQSKVLWVVLPIVVGLSCLGWIVAIVYFTKIRPQVADAERHGRGSPY
ncbi:MAG TPA: hypothetical protein VIL36_04550 [Acidimicrobiales bacterium]